jgi:hypothetical protein
MREGAGLTTKDDDVFDEALADQADEGGVVPAAEETVGVEAAS